MGVFRPYESKRRIQTALERGYWREPYDMTAEERAEAEQLYIWMRILYPWSKEKRAANANGQQAVAK